MIPIATDFLQQDQEHIGNEVLRVDGARESHEVSKSLRRLSISMSSETLYSQS